MTRASVSRRLAAACYDGLLVIALLMIITALLQLITHGNALVRVPSADGLMPIKRCCWPPWWGTSMWVGPAKVKRWA